MAFLLGSHRKENIRGKAEKKGRRSKTVKGEGKNGEAQGVVTTEEGLRAECPRNVNYRMKSVMEKERIRRRSGGGRSIKCATTPEQE